MKGPKNVATIIICALLLVAGIAAQCMALVQFTVLNPAFYGKGESEAYELVGRIIVRRLSDGVLDKVPPIALKTTDREKAFELASEALPPRRITEMLESSGPSVIKFLLKGGDMPVLQGAGEFQAGETALIKNLLMDDLLKVLPEKPSFPAFMPFTPEWNLSWGPSLNGVLALPRYYAGMTWYVLAAATAAAVLFAGLLYLIWIRERKRFLWITGGLLAANGLWFAILAAVVSFGCKSMANGLATSPLFRDTAALFGSDWPELVRTALWPFRQIFFLPAVMSLSLAAAALGASVTQPEPHGMWPAGGAVPRHKHERPATVKKPKPVMAESIWEPENETPKENKPKHAKRT